MVDGIRDSFDVGKNNPLEAFVASSSIELLSARRRHVSYMKGMVSRSHMPLGHAHPSFHTSEVIHPR